MKGPTTGGTMVGISPEHSYATIAQLLTERLEGEEVIGEEQMRGGGVALPDTCLGLDAFASIPGLYPTVLKGRTNQLDVVTLDFALRQDASVSLNPGSDAVSDLPLQPKPNELIPNRLWAVSPEEELSDGA
eukprot:11248788-Alexandrium_andersonii.AAC.1